MSVGGQSEATAFRVRFAVFASVDRPQPGYPYIGTFEINDATGTASGVSPRIPRTMTLLGVALAVAAVMILNAAGVRGSGGMLRAALIGAVIGGATSSLGWLIARWRRVRLPVPLGELRMDVSDDWGEPYIQIFRPHGPHLHVTPDPHRQADFHRLRAALIRLQETG